MKRKRFKNEKVKIDRIKKTKFSQTSKEESSFLALRGVFPIVVPLIAQSLDLASLARLEQTSVIFRDYIKGNNCVWKEQAKKKGMPENYRAEKDEPYKEKLRIFLEEKKVRARYPNEILDIFGSRLLSQLHVFTSDDLARNAENNLDNVTPEMFQEKGSSIVRSADMVPKTFIGFCLDGPRGKSTVFLCLRDIASDYFCIWGDRQNYIPNADNENGDVEYTYGSNICFAQLNYIKRLVNGEPCGRSTVNIRGRIGRIELEEKKNADGTSIVRLAEVVEPRLVEEADVRLRSRRKKSD